MNVRALSARAAAIIKLAEQLKAQIEGLRDDAQGWMDDCSEKWQESDACTEWEERVSTLESAMDEVDELVEYLQELVQQ